LLPATIDHHISHKFVFFPSSLPFFIEYAKHFRIFIVKVEESNHTNDVLFEKKIMTTWDI